MNSAEKVVTFHPSAACGREFAALLTGLQNECRPVKIVFDRAVYHFDKADAAEVFQPISNTLVYDGKEHCRHVGILLENLSDITLQGNGAQLIFNGDMTPLALLDCRNIRMEDFSVDFVRRRISEMTLAEKAGDLAVFAIHPQSRYEVSSNTLNWINPDGILEDRESFQIVQCASLSKKSNCRTPYNPIREATACREIGENLVEFTYNGEFPGEVGEVWQFRDPERNEVGILLHRCKDTVMDKLQLNFTPGLGIVAQMCENIAIVNHTHAPEKNSGLVCSAFADCIQISSCRGKVEIADSYFSGAQDDPINIHGTYLPLISAERCRLHLRFGHAETWGFLPFDAGDEIAVVDTASLERGERRRILQAEQKSLRDVELIIDRPLEKDYPENSAVIENMSAYPEVIVENNRFEYYPTRGLLLSTAKKAVVRGNIFCQTSPSAGILIAGDAGSWFESGGVTDVLIENNRFESCRNSVIALRPENRVPGMIHAGIKIKNNSFEQCSGAYLEIKGCADIIHDVADDKIKNVNI